MGDKMDKNLEKMLGKKQEEEDKKEEEQKDLFSQEQKELLKASILKIGMKNFMELQQFNGAENDLIETLQAESENTRETYFNEVKERADIENVSEMDILAEDAIAIKSAKMENKDYNINPTSGRVDICDEEETELQR